jgi:hypothetical protein
VFQLVTRSPLVAGRPQERSPQEGTRRIVAWHSSLRRRNGNHVPDECDVADDPTVDCDDNGVLDICATRWACYLPSGECQDLRDACCKNLCGSSMPGFTCPEFGVVCASISLPNVDAAHNVPWKDTQRDPPLTAAGQSTTTHRTTQSLASQLAVVRERSKRPGLRKRDRIFWAVLPDSGEVGVRPC